MHTGEIHDTAEPRRTNWSAILLLLLLAISSYIDRSVMAMLVEPMRNELAVNDFQISLLQGFAFALFYSVCGIPIGSLVDRYSPRLIIFVGLVIWSIAAASTGLAGSYTSLFIARACVGVGEAALAPAAFTLISATTPKRYHTLATATFASGTLLGMALAATLGGWALSYFTSTGGLDLPFLGKLEPWRAVFIAVALPGLLLAPLVIFLPDVPVRAKAAGRPANWRAFTRILADRPAYFVSTLLGFALVATLGTAAGAWYPTYLIRHFGMPVNEAGALLGLVTVAAGLPGFLFAGYVIDRLRERGELGAHQCYGAVSAVIVSLAGMGAFLVDGPYFSLSCYAFIAFFTPVGGAAVAHLHNAVPPHFRGRITALYLLGFTLLGFGLGPSIVAALTDFVFEDPQLIGRSLFWTFAAIGPLAAIILFYAIGPARQAVTAANATD